jgi:hypothetical protein
MPDQRYYPTAPTCRDTPTHPARHQQHQNGSYLPAAYQPHPGELLVYIDRSSSSSSAQPREGALTTTYTPRQYYTTSAADARPRPPSPARSASPLSREAPIAAEHAYYYPAAAGAARAPPEYARCYSPATAALAPYMPHHAVPWAYADAAPQAPYASIHGAPPEQAQEQLQFKEIARLPNGFVLFAGPPPPP